MRRKRINHQVDTFCDIFVGWQLMNDIKTLTKLKSGILKFDFKNKISYLNGEISPQHFNQFESISNWFYDDLEKHNISINDICEAFLEVNFNIREVEKGIDEEKRKLNIVMDLFSKIQTDEKEYSRSFRHHETHLLN